MVKVSVQATAVGVPPPNAKAAVFVPAPAKHILAVIKAPPADQAVPLYDSVHDVDDQIMFQSGHHAKPILLQSVCETGQILLVPSRQHGL